MLSTNEIREIIRKVTYKPGARIDVRLDFERNRPTLIVEVPVQDVRTLETARIATYPEIPTRYLKSRGALLAFIFIAVEGIEKHEVREWLRYDKDAIVDPHPESKPLGWLARLFNLL
jgi:hypothetical protein